MPKAVIELGSFLENGVHFREKLALFCNFRFAPRQPKAKRRRVSGAVS
jgi:hypothetical protein